MKQLLPAVDNLLSHMQQKVALRPGHEHRQGSQLGSETELQSRQSPCLQADAPGSTHGSSRLISLINSSATA